MKTRTDENLQETFVASAKDGSSLRQVFAAAIYLDKTNAGLWPGAVAAAEQIIEVLDRYGAAGEFAVSHLAFILSTRRVLSRREGLTATLDEITRTE